MSDVGKQISWSIFGFIAGMFIVVRTLEGSGLTAEFGQLLVRFSGHTTFGAVMVGTLGAAMGTNLINNVPMASCAQLCTRRCAACCAINAPGLCGGNDLWLRPRAQSDNGGFAGDSAVAAYFASPQH